MLRYYFFFLRFPSLNHRPHRPRIIGKITPRSNFHFRPSTFGSYAPPTTQKMRLLYAFSFFSPWTHFNERRISEAANFFNYQHNLQTWNFSLFFFRESSRVNFVHFYLVSICVTFHRWFRRRQRAKVMPNLSALFVFLSLISFNLIANQREEMPGLLV